MSSITRKQKEKEIRKNDILDAAEELFATKGIVETTMNDIAQKAEFTKRTVYAYFSSKEELYLAVFVKSVKIRWAFQRAEIEKQSNGYNKIYAFGDSYYRFFADYPFYLDLTAYLDFSGINIQNVSQEISDEYEALNTGAIGVIKQVFLLGIQDNSIRDDLNIDMTISHLFYSLRAILRRAMMMGQFYTFAQFDQREYYYQFLNLFLKSIQGDSL